MEYLTTHDLVWINSSITGSTNTYNYITLEAAMAGQYSYGASSNVTAQAATLLRKILDTKPFTEGNIPVTATDFTATINWGDGTSSTGIITSSDAGGFAVSASHTFGVAKTYSATVVIADSTGTTSQAKVVVKVTKGVKGRRPVKGGHGRRYGAWSLSSYWQQAKSMSR